MDKAEQKKLFEEAARKRYHKEQKEKREGTLEQHPNTWMSDCCGSPIHTVGARVFCLYCGEELD